MDANTLTKTLGEDLFIDNIFVDQLFGLYTYDLNIEDEGLFIDDKTKNLLFILYGDNGSGKTTLLQLIYHLLTYELQGGHKTHIARTLFKEFAINFENKLSVRAVRDKAEKGGFNFVISKNNEVIFDIFVGTDRDLAVRIDETIDEADKYNQALNFLEQLNLNLYFLSDARNLKTSTVTDSDERFKWERRHRRLGRNVAPSHRKSRELEKINEQRENLIIDSAVSRVSEWIKTNALDASDIGEENTNTIYTQIIKRIASPTQSFRKGEINENGKGIDINEVKKLSEQIDEYAKYGLISSIDFDEILEIYQDSNKDKKDLISRVIEPYINGLKSRLEALEEIKEIIDKFINGINYFLRDKYITFDIKKGIRIITKKSNQLDPSDLSSGEKQLLLLFCNTVTARDQATIFIIDEPEISLNIKWQRKIIKSLLEVAKGSQIQFVMATHSIELITNYSQSVSKLVPLNG